MNNIIHSNEVQLSNTNLLTYIYLAQELRQTITKIQNLKHFHTLIHNVTVTHIQVAKA